MFKKKKICVVSGFALSDLLDKHLSCAGVDSHRITGGLGLERTSGFIRLSCNVLSHVYLWLSFMRRNIHTCWSVKYIYIFLWHLLSQSILWRTENDALNSRWWQLLLLGESHFQRWMKDLGFEPVRLIPLLCSPLLSGRFLVYRREKQFDPHGLNQIRIKVLHWFIMGI